MTNLKNISTEANNVNTKDIDLLSTSEIIKIINDEDQKVALAVSKEITHISAVVDAIVECFMHDGRLIYVGAGTSGRIGILDAVECPPTYGVDEKMVMCLMAGGKDAFVQAKEGAEDSKELAHQDLEEISLTKNDIVIGLAASGRTPYVIGAIEKAKTVGAKTACVTTSKGSLLASIVDYPIEVATGQEVIAGSTRMKSGTAQKMVCNMLSTASMIKMGRVYGNYMIDLKPTNEKLIARAISIVSEIIDCDLDTAKMLIEKFGTVKKVLVAHFGKTDDLQLINESLDQTKGNVRKAIALLQTKK